MNNYRLPYNCSIHILIQTISTLITHVLYFGDNPRCNDFLSFYDYYSFISQRKTLSSILSVYARLLPESTDCSHTRILLEFWCSAARNAALPSQYRSLLLDCPLFTSQRTDLFTKISLQLNIDMTKLTNATKLNILLFGHETKNKHILFSEHFQKFSQNTGRLS